MSDDWVCKKCGLSLDDHELAEVIEHLFDKPCAESRRTAERLFDLLWPEAPIPR